jgi:fumarylpyruvate hydrolase
MQFTLKGSELPDPMAIENLNHEIELVVTIGRNGTNLSDSEALDFVFGCTVGLDLISRDMQGEANKKCRLWTVQLHVLLCT